MDTRAWISNMSREQIEAASAIISRNVFPPAIDVRRRGRSLRPWVIVLNGYIQTDTLGRPRRFKTRKSGLLAAKALRR